jgi:hypothetical protein
MFYGQRWLGGGLVFCVVWMSVCPSFVWAREMSKSGEIFNQVKDSIVTIVSAGHGSGFLADDAGLIVTNSHVVNESGNDIRVRFGPGQVVRGMVIENNRDADVAVIYVNLENIKGVKSIPLYNPENNNDLVLVGEKVIAIGSPLQWETMEKTLTEGVAGKFENNIIRHDARINRGNSGGPLLNFDGQVIGINTFAEADKGMAPVSCSVASSKIVPVLQAAQKKLATASKPDGTLLQDIPRTPFPISQLLLEGGKKLPKRVKPYSIHSNYFTIDLMTPPLGYRQIVAYDEHLLKKRKNRAKDKGFTVTDDEYESKNKFKFYDYEKPVVSVYVTPNPKLTTASKILSTVSFVSALSLTVLSAGIGAPSLAVPFMVAQREVKKDFLKMSIRSTDKSYSCDPYASGRSVFTSDYAFFINNMYTSLVDKSYIGIYEFSAKCFESPKPLEFVIESEGDKKMIEKAIPIKIKQSIVTDFKPYWGLGANAAK